MRLRVLGFVVLLLASAITPAASQPVNGELAYTFTDLGGFLPEAINGSGQLAGVALKPSGQFGAFRWHDGILEEIDIPRPTNALINAYGINATGHVAGWVELSGVGQRGFLWNGSTATILDTLGGATSAAYALNSQDQAVGYAETADGQMRAVLWNGTIPTDLGSLGGSSWANGVNDLGQVVGQSEIGQTFGQSRAFLYDNGVMTDLGTLGGTHSAGYAITNDGLVLGWSLLPGDQIAHPFLWQNGIMTDLGGVPGSTGTTELVNTINRHGEIVGTTQLTLGANDLHAVLYRNGTYTDLNTLLPNGSGWVLRIAQRINDAGQIVGQGLFNGVFRGFLLTPVGGTVAGDDVSIATTVELPDGSKPTTTLAFESVVEGGVTTVTASDTGPTVPGGFQLPEPPVFFDVQTTAVVSGIITLCFSWAEGALQNESNARLLHFEGDQWLDITTSVNQQSNTVCGQATSLSPFAIAELGFEFLGFNEPLLADGSASIQQRKAGRAIPVKFQLKFGGELTGAAEATISVNQVLDVAVGTVDTTDLTEDAGTANEDSNRFRYDEAAKQYIFNLSTKGWQAPATYRIVASISDGRTYTVHFSLRP
jgi:probable HAF family extracellular repeat protein